MQRHLDYTAQLPEEILEAIIRKSGPRFITAASENGFPDKTNWLSCSSVCHRWHRIAMPYAFRCVRVHPSDNFMDTAEDRAASRFESFLHENPSIASLIEECNLTRVLVEIKVLRNILTALTNLQYFVFHRSFIEERTDLRGPPTTCRVSKLMYTGGACDLYDYPWSVCKWQIPVLLRSFSVIGEFEELRGCYHVDDRPLEQSEGEVSQVHSYNTEVSSHSIEHLDVLHRLRIFDYLSCLQLTLPSPLEISAEFVNNFLEIVGGSLHELSLKIGHITSTPFPMSPQCTLRSLLYNGSCITNTLHYTASEVAGLIRRGVAACHSLHGFRLELRHANFNSLVDEEHVRETFAFGIGIGIEIISFLHATNLTHLSFCYRPLFESRRSLEDIRGIDFSRLRDIHHRFVGLRSLTLDTYNNLEGPEESHLRRELVACVRGRLQGFNGALYHDEPGSFFRCDEPLCAWSSNGKLNKYMTLHREVFRSYWANR